MKYLFDTSVLVAAHTRAHAAHRRCLPWMQRAAARELELVLAGHALAELYATLTALPVRPRFTPEMVLQIVDQSILPVARLETLSPAEYNEMLRRLKAERLAGAVTYDAIHAFVAEREAVDGLLTLNPGDFHRLWPTAAALVLVP